MSDKFVLIFAVAAFIGATHAIPVELVNKMLEYREKCIALSGSEEGYQQIIASIEPTKTCILNRMDLQQFQTDATQLALGSRKPFFDKYCPIFNESVSCFDDTVEGVAKCVGDDVDSVKAIIKNAAHNLLDLVCQDDGQLFFDFQKREYKECVTQLKEHGAQECAVSDLTKGTGLSKYGEQQCQDLENARQCIKSKIDECDAPRLFDVFQVAFNAVSNANSCKQYTTLGEISSNSIDGSDPVVSGVN